MSGRLFIIATPIGNLSDLTLRAKEALENCELVLAEDTRVTLKLLNHLGLKKKLLSCHDFNEHKRKELIQETDNYNKNIALISDAGMPLISDPGYLIVQEAIKAEMQIIPIPGACAFLLGLVGSGLKCDRFSFEGFLPDKQKARKERLTKLKNDDRTLIFYVSPHDLQTILDDLYLQLGDRLACLARELTKLHEEFTRGTLSYLKSYVQENAIRGEYVLIVEGNEFKEECSKEEILEKMGKMLQSGESLKDTATFLADETGWSKSKLYQLGLEYQKSNLDD